MEQDQAPTFKLTKDILGQIEKNTIPIQMIALGLVILGAYLGGQVTRRLGLSNVTGQMLGGAITGPYALHLMGLLPDNALYYDFSIATFHFFVFVFLCLIAFGIGEEMHVSRIKKVGKSAIGISLIHSLICFSVVTIPFLLLSDLSALEIMIIASISITSAPAISIVMLNQLRIEGRLRYVTAGVLVITDLLGVLLFSFFVQLCQKGSKIVTGAEAGGKEAGVDIFGVLLPVAKEIGMATLIGIGVYVLLRILVRREAAAFDEMEPNSSHARSQHPLLVRMFAAHPSPSVEILMITIGAVSLGAGLAYMWHLPFLITALVAGFLVANLHSFAIFDSLKIDNITPVFNLMFFALVGATMYINAGDSEIMMLSGLYIITRSVGKLCGTWIGCKAMGEDAAVTAALPSQLLPQTGVAAVEAVYVAYALGRPELSGIILPAIVVFGVIGVIKVERALSKFVIARNAANKSNKEKASPLAEAARRLLAFLSPEAVILELKGKNKFEVISEMIDRAQKVSSHHIDRELAIQMVNEREKLAPTGLGHGIAIPHCRLIGLDEPVLILARHNEGVVFGGIDDNPCNLIMMILTSGRNPSDHLQIMAAAAHLFSNPAIRNNLKSAPTGELLMHSIFDIAEQSQEAGIE